MTPILYDKNETAFTSAGLGFLSEARRCEVTEERNGQYELLLEYPASGKLYDKIQIGCYIMAAHDESGVPQAFEIYATAATVDEWVEYRAWHISYKLNNIILNPFSANSCSDAFSMLGPSSIGANPFTFWTNKQVAGSYSIDVPRAVRSVLGGAEGSLLDVYGTGEYEFDMMAVKLYTHRGQDNGVTIRYGKNLTQLQRELDASETYNALVPYWQGEDGSVVALDHAVVRTGETVAKPIAYDCSDDYETAPTLAELEAHAQSIIDNSSNYIIKDNISIDFVALWQTEEYKSFAALQRIRLCDTVSVILPRHGIVAKAKCIKTVYDALEERYISLELGEPRTTLAQQIAEVVGTEALKNVPTYGTIQAAIERATALLTGANGGYKVELFDADGYPTDTLYMDTNDVNTATNVLRINKNGIGFSRTGINGPYYTAWTIDSAFNADFITAGTLSADRIATGSISIGKLDTGTQNSINTANNREQIIYRSAPSGTTSMAANTTWVTANGNTQNAWTTTRPVYNSSYPVLFVATQRQTMQQAGGSECSCTTPVIDQTTTVIDGGHITTGTIDASVVNVTKINADNITGGTISADRIGAKTIAIGKLDTSTQNAISTASADAATAKSTASAAQSTANSAASAASAAQSTANGANSREQRIYRSAASGTTSMAANTTWVTASGNTQNAWTTTRPVYNSSYPVLFVATQRQTVQQAGGSSCSCTNPVIDQTTTVIDGGHITTGTIDASKVNVTKLNASNITTGTISDATGKNSWNLTTGKFITTDGTIGGWTINASGLTASGSNGASESLLPTGIVFTGPTTGTPRTRTIMDADELTVQAYVSNAWRNAVQLKTALYSGGLGGLISAGSAGNPDIWLVPDESGAGNTEIVLEAGDVFINTATLKTYGTFRAMNDAQTTNWASVISSITGGSTTPSSAGRSVTAVRFGNLVTLNIVFTNGAVAGANSGNNRTIEMKLTDDWKPAVGGSGAGYWSNRAFVAQVYADGSLNIRNCSATNTTFTASSPLRIAVTYICNNDAY